MKNHWLDGISLSSGIVAVRQYREPRTKRDEEKEDDCPTDFKTVLGRRPSARIKWLHRALALANAGKINKTTLYDIIAHPKYTTSFSADLNGQLQDLLQVNVDLFSPKQQRFFLSQNMLPLPELDDAGSRRSTSSSSNRGASCFASREVSPSSARKGGGAATALSRLPALDPGLGDAADLHMQTAGHPLVSPMPFAVASRSLGAGRGLMSAGCAQKPEAGLHECHSVGPILAQGSESGIKAAAVAVAVAKAAAVAAQNLRIAAASAASVAAATTEVGGTLGQDEQASSASFPLELSGPTVADSAPSVVQATSSSRAPMMGKTNEGASLGITPSKREVSPSTQELQETSRSTGGESLAGARSGGNSRSPGSAGRRDARVDDGHPWHNRIDHNGQESRRHRSVRSRTRDDSHTRTFRRESSRQHRRSSPRSLRKNDVPPVAGTGDAVVSLKRKDKSDHSRSRSRKARRDRTSKWDESSKQEASVASERMAELTPAILTGIRSAGGSSNSPETAAPQIKVSSPWFKALTIPGTQVGHLIGPRGASITQIRQLSGADIKINQRAGSNSAIITITGKTVEIAERLIYEKLASAPVPPGW